MQILQNDNRVAATTIISVEEAEKIIFSQATDYGMEEVDVQKSYGRVLAEDIRTDRDWPPFDRAAMDGIAIRYHAFENGVTQFKVRSVQAAGDHAVSIDNDEDCIEIMTGAALHSSVNTVIRYEDIIISDGHAIIKTGQVRAGQNVHRRGQDKKMNDMVAEAGQVMNPALISIAVSAGHVQVKVKKLPRVLVVSTGNELVDAGEQPGTFQIRSSNGSLVSAALHQLGVEARPMHWKDDESEIMQQLHEALQQYDVLVICGAVSKGKFDFIPSCLEAAGVEKLLHQVMQKPGKPLWFGKKGTQVKIFGFPGNPISTMVCLYRYLIPWLEISLGIKQNIKEAILQEDVSFLPPLQYFLPVQLSLQNAALVATPVTIHGSGDFAGIAHADAFMELPAERSNFKKGEMFRVWPLKNII